MRRLVYDKDGRVRMGLSIMIMLTVVLIAAPILVYAVLETLVALFGGDATVLFNLFGTPPGRLLLSVSYVVNIALILWLWKLIYKKPFRYLGVGLTDGLKQAFAGLMLGLSFGFVSFSAVYMIMFLMGAVRVLDFNPARLFSTDTLSFFIVFIFVGIYEELLGRGYIMYALSERLSKVVVIVISAVFFAVLHLGNNGIAFLPILNLFLVGVLFALMFIKTGRLWIAIGFHIIWNFAQGSIFGLNVSGIPTASSVFLSEPIGSGIINGGAFGPEGGIAVTLVILSGIVCFYLRGDNFHLFRNNTNTH